MKKKYLFLVVLGCFALLLTGCGNDQEQDVASDNNNNNSNQTEEKGLNSSEDSSEEKTMVCRNSASQSNMATDLTYTVRYKGEDVTSVKSVETIKSDDTDLLEAYREQVEAIYEPYKGIEYYEYQVEVEGDLLTSTVNIDYEHIDTDKLIDVDSSNATLIKDGKVSIDDIESLYEQVGATCERDR